MERFAPMERFYSPPRLPPRPAFAAGLALAGLLGCYGDQGRHEQTTDAPVPPAEAVPARSGALPLAERLNGRVRAENQVAVRPEIEAPVVEVLVKSGEAVERGQPLVRLRDDTLRDQLRQTEAAVKLASASARQARARVAELEAQVVRSRALAAEELISAVSLETQEAQLAAAEAGADQAEAQVEQARATVEERRSALSRALVRSPVAGRVGQRNAEPGMLADPATALFVVGNLDELVVEVPLAEEMLTRVEEGQSVLVTAQGLDEPVRAVLSRISPFLQAGSFSTVGEIDLANRGGRLRPGMFVTVDVLYGESERATLVPVSALWDDPDTGALGVYVAAMDGAAEPRETPADVPPEATPVELRPVEVVAEGRGAAGVRGVEPGEWVLTVGQHLLADGGAGRARVRPTTWERVLELQERQREDLVESFLGKQQRLARERGLEPPSSEEFLEGGGGAEP